VPISGRNRVETKEGIPEDKSARGAYDFFAAYQHAKVHPDFLHLEVVSNEAERKFIRPAAAVWTVVAHYRDFRWDMKLAFFYDPEDAESTTLLSSQATQALCTLYGEISRRFWTEDYVPFEQDDFVIPGFQAYAEKLKNGA
jgi:hypothetical protein